MVSHTDGTVPDATRTSQRVRTIRKVLSRASERRIVLRMLAWRLVLPWLKRSFPIARLVALMLQPAPSATSLPPDRIVELARLVCRARLLSSHDNCLDRSLIAYRYLRAVGARPSLAVGLGRDNAAVIGHAWIVLDGRPLGETHDAIESFTKVISFGPEGF